MHPTSPQGGSSRHRDRPKAAGGSTLPKLLVGIGLAWLTLADRRPRPSPARRGEAGGHPQPGEPTAHDSADPQSRDARSPTEIPARGWWQVLMRVKDEISNDNMSIVAAGCAFYALLALFPAITALVSIYGLVADPAQVERQLTTIEGVVPQEAFSIIQDQAHAVAQGGRTALGWGAALALLFALYSASSGIKSLFEALNIAYEEEETRGFIRYNLTALAFTLGAVIGVAVGVGVIVVLPAMLGFLPLGPITDWAVRIGSWLILLALVIGGLALLYRFGPARAPASWRWLSPGSIVATILWLAASLAFSVYAANFASYNETYGALGGVIVLLMWLWISAFVVLLGAELNAELELQTRHDTTTGQPMPKGKRDAYVADRTAGERVTAPARG